jgi:hypothetical protein
MKRYFCYLILIGFLTGCEMLGGSGSAVAATTTNSGQIAGDMTTEIENTINQMTWWQFGAVVLLAGWAIPSPMEMIRGMFGGVFSIVKLFKNV